MTIRSWAIEILIFNFSSYSGANILKMALAGSCIPKFSFLILSFLMSPTQELETLVMVSSHLGFLDFCWRVSYLSLIYLSQRPTRQSKLFVFGIFARYYLAFQNSWSCNKNSFVIDIIERDWLPSWILRSLSKNKLSVSSLLGLITLECISRGRYYNPTTIRSWAISYFAADI